MSKMKLKQGESSDIFRVTVSGAGIAVNGYVGFTGTLWIMDTVTNASVLGPVNIDPGTAGFLVAVTPTQSGQLAVGTYTAILKIEKDEEFAREVSWTVQITESLV